MTIKKKASRGPILIQMDIEDKIDQMISRGGKTSVDNEPIPSLSEPQKEDEIRFTLRISSRLINKIDASRKLRVGNVSRNQWIIETIGKAVE